MKIAVAGTGYVGLSNAILLAQNHQVTAVDVVPEKVEMINNKKSPVIDKEIMEYLETKELNLVATVDAESAYKDAELIIISTPTNYDPKLNFFDTSSVEAVIELVLKMNPFAPMVIKSTIRLVIQKVFLKSIIQTEFCSLRNFYEKDMLCMITYIHPELLWV